MTALTVDQAFRRALECYAAGDPRAAEQILRAVLQLEPGHAAACLLALILAQRGDGAAAEQLIRQAARRPAFSITLDYPAPDAARHNASPHARLHGMFRAELDRYAAVLAGLGDYLAWLKQISGEPSGDAQPHWSNIWLPPVDAATLYARVAAGRPARYVEVGSGNSTRFVSRAIEDHRLDTEIVSIDPEPRGEIEALCDVSVRKPLEKADLSVFRTLGAGDVVFIDNSHRCFMSSDVTVFFTEVLPELAPGVIVGIHDIFLPYDYPQAWAGRYYSEQYLLACYLLGRTPLFRVLLPTHFMLQEPDQAAAARRLCAALPGAPAAAGSSFWLEMNG